MSNILIYISFFGVVIMFICLEIMLIKLTHIIEEIRELLRSKNEKNN